MFPDAPRVIYDKNPLEEVVCQIRFPSILEIETTVPSEFQSRIRAQYPEYETRVTGQGGLPAEVPAEIRSLFEGLQMPSGVDRRLHHDFKSADGWTITLAREFLAVSTTHYVRWEEFRERTRAAYKVLLETYKPPYTTRLGLRYKNVIRRSDLGLLDVPWKELLSRQIAGELAASELPDDKIEELQRRLRADLDDGLRLTLQHGLARPKNAPTSERVYLIDADLHTEERLDAADERIWDYLDRANGHVRRIFHWAIDERLDKALGPHAAR